MIDSAVLEEREQLSKCLQAVAQQRDRQAFKQFFDHYAGRIKAFAMKSPGMSGSTDLAEDVVQETMLKVWNKAGLFDKTKSNMNVDAWVYTIARNVRIDIQRRAIRTDSSKLEADDLWHGTEAPEPAVQFNQHQIAENVRAGLDAINSEQALVLRKMYLEGKSQSEIAKEFDLPLGTVKSRTRLALARLKLLLQEKEL